MNQALEVEPKKKKSQINGEPFSFDIIACIFTSLNECKKSIQTQ